MVLFHCVRLWKVSHFGRPSQSSVCWTASTVCYILRGAAAERTAQVRAVIVKLCRMIHTIISVVEMMTTNIFAL